MLVYATGMSTLLICQHRITLCVRMWNRLIVHVWCGDNLVVNTLLQMFGDVVIGRMGLVIFPLLVALATFSSAHVSLMTQSR